MKNIILRSVVVLFISIFFLPCLAAYAAESPYDLAWVRQIGTTDDDWSFSVAVDGLGDAYISGWTSGSLGGPNAGGEDAFLAKYDSSGSLLWTRQIGTTYNDWSNSVAVDDSGNAYISGFTYGSLGGPNAGSWDGFLAKYDASGSLVWTSQIGTPLDERSWSVAVDGLGNAYISGFTYGSLGGPNAGADDAFLAKYDSSGSLLWTRQLGTSNSDQSFSVAIDGSGNAYISGFTNGSLGGPNAGCGDAFLAKYDSSGSLLWTSQIGTAADDESWSVAVDGSGNAYISGGWNDPSPFGLAGDAFLAKYDSSGNLLWTNQIGTTGDKSRSVAVDGWGNAYISGYTGGSIGSPNAGLNDAFLAKFSAPIPEPRTVFIIATAALGLAGIAFRKMRRD